MADLHTIRTTLDAHKQSHLLNFYDQLDPDRRETLLSQIAAVDFDLLDELIESHVRNEPAVTVPQDVQPPEILPAEPTDPALRKRYDTARLAGTELITDGKIAAFVVAGGQGTRLGYDGPKGCYPATPIMKKPLFQLFAEQILAAARRAEKPIPWYVMTSPTNDAATQDFFRRHNFFGLPEKDVLFFTQGTLPAIGTDGRILLAEKHALATSPNGHGGSLTALADSGALADMAARGIELISYFQVDNPLVRVLDPLFVGLHHLAHADASAKALPKRDPMEKLGNFCRVDGKVTVIEYSDMPEDLARATTHSGHLKFPAGSIAIHIFSRTFIETLTAGRCRLPFHRALKKVPCIDDQGNRVEPETPNAVKLEMFVFDALPLADNCLILETTRPEEFSPIKNASGSDSPDTCLHDQIRRAATWLESTNVTVPRDADGQVAAAIEISPLYADSPQTLAQKIDPNLHITPGQDLYLE